MCNGDISGIVTIGSCQWSAYQVGHFGGAGHTGLLRGHGSAGLQRHPGHFNWLPGCVGAVTSIRKRAKEDSIPRLPIYLS